ncbi:MAG: hypothetical protein ACYDH2_14605 [Anaerolineaceae bacterium]
MIPEVDLLTNDNLCRHINSKIKLYASIQSEVVTRAPDANFSMYLPVVTSYLEAAIVDTIQEYTRARPYEILQTRGKEKFEKKHKYLKYDELIQSEFSTWAISTYLDDVAFLEVKNKIIELKKICGIEVDLGNQNWEYIVELIARRNCFIHNDLIANSIYLDKAGNKKQAIETGKKIIVDKSYIIERIINCTKLLNAIKEQLVLKYSTVTNISAIHNLWKYVFYDNLVLRFDQCWNVDDAPNIHYVGPSEDDLRDSISPRMLCLFTAWRSFFNGYHSDLKYFSQIYCGGFPEHERKYYSERLKYLIDIYDYIDFQSFHVNLYAKESK